MKKLTIIFYILFFCTIFIIAQQRTDYYRLSKKVDANGQIKTYNNGEGQFVTRNKGYCFDSSIDGMNAGNGTLTLTERKDSRSAYHGKSYFGNPSDYIFDDSRGLLNVKNTKGEIYVFYIDTPPKGKRVPTYVSDWGFLDGTYQNMFDNTIQQGMNSSSSSSSTSSKTSTKSKASPKLCTSCHGTKRCSLCNGKGRYQPNPARSTIVDCSKCHKTGDCSLCKGTGYFGVTR